MEKLEGENTLQRPRRRWENNIKIDLKFMKWKGGDSINMVHYAHKWQDYVNTAINEFQSFTLHFSFH